MTFDEFWSSLPSEMKKGSKPRAARRYATIEKKGEIPLLNAALDAYVLDQRENMWRKFMHGPSFLDRFREWLPEERTEAIVDEKPEIGLFEPLKAHKHWCRQCRPPHDWQCSDPDCIYPGHALCEQATKKVELSGVFPHNDGGSYHQ